MHDKVGQEKSSKKQAHLQQHATVKKAVPRADSQAGPRGLLGPVGHPSDEDQAKHLNERRIPVAQRQAMAHVICRRHGNQYLQRVLVTQRDSENQPRAGIELSRSPISATHQLIQLRPLQYDENTYYLNQIPVAHEQRFRARVRSECGWIAIFRSDEGERLDDLLDNHSNLDAFYAQLLASGRRGRGDINIVLRLTRGQGRRIESMQFSEVGGPEPSEEETETHTFLHIITRGRTWRSYRHDVRIPLQEAENYRFLEGVHREMGTALAAQMRDMASWQQVPWEFYRELDDSLRGIPRGPQNIDVRVELHTDVTVTRGANRAPHFHVNRTWWQLDPQAITGELPPGETGAQLQWEQMREENRNQMLNIAWQAAVDRPNPIMDVQQFIEPFEELRNRQMYWVRVRAFSDQVSYPEALDRSAEYGAEGSPRRRSYEVGRGLGRSARPVLFGEIWRLTEARWISTYGGSPEHDYYRAMRDNENLRREVIAGAVRERYGSDEDRAALYRRFVANEPAY